MLEDSPYLEPQLVMISSSIKIKLDTIIYGIINQLHQHTSISPWAMEVDSEAFITFGDNITVLLLPTCPLT